MDRKEEEITKRIEMLRRKNELLEQRHKEVQADKISAEKLGQSMLQGPQHVESFQERNRMSGNQRIHHSRAHMDSVSVNDDPRSNYRNRRIQQRGRARSTTNPAPSRRGRHTQDYEAKRLENFLLMEEEMTQTPEKNENDTSSGISRLLDDPRREGELDPDNRWKSTRHKGSYGGLHFDNVKSGVLWRGRGQRGGRRGRGMSRLQMTAEYTGKERKDQERWLLMREAADREIMARSKNAQGGWKREWDSEKVDAAEPIQSPEHPEHQFVPRPRGRGRRGIGINKRYSHGGSQEQSINYNTEVVSSGRKEHVEVVGQEELAVVPVMTKPQQIRNNPSKTPKTLLQQRAQTPSSKDGTEVWAQNSHHSDEAGGEWKNGKNQSGDQWLPSSEGNSNPAIDERLLEQQDDGATVYSQQLGRGWGSEKNIKATKAWVLDTEKAGSTKSDPQDEITDRKDDTDCSKTIEDEHNTRLSTSPRLKYKNFGLTVEITKKGSRSVKSNNQQSETTPTQGLIEPATELAEAEKSNFASPLSPDFLKTPEGMKHVTDWAAEMDMQSPTYEMRQIELQKNLDNQVSAQTPEEPQPLEDVNTTKSDCTNCPIQPNKTNELKVIGNRSELEECHGDILNVPVKEQIPSATDEIQLKGNDSAKDKLVFDSTVADSTQSPGKDGDETVKGNSDRENCCDNAEVVENEKPTVVKIQSQGENNEAMEKSIHVSHMPEILSAHETTMKEKCNELNPSNISGTDPSQIDKDIAEQEDGGATPFPQELNKPAVSLTATEELEKTVSSEPILPAVEEIQTQGGKDEAMEESIHVSHMPEKLSPHETTMKEKCNDEVNLSNISGTDPFEIDNDVAKQEDSVTPCPQELNKPVVSLTATEELNKTVSSDFEPIRSDDKSPQAVDQNVTEDEFFECEEDRRKEDRSMHGCSVHRTAASAVPRGNGDSSQDNGVPLTSNAGNRADCKPDEVE